MAVPQVVIVGRPNVGKSSLFNWLAGKRIAIVDDVPGVTRDRISHLMCEDDRYFEIIDTGGIGIEDVDNLTEQIQEQISYSIDTADVILFTVDTRSGMVPLDQDVAQRLRYVDKPIICVANKTDTHEKFSDASEFYRLGRGKLLPISVHQNINKSRLMDMIVERLPVDRPDADEVSEPVMKVAIVGRRNVGKSTFVNSLAKAERMIVSEVPGTTRDSVDVRFELDDQAFIAIDTPGLRKSKSIRTDIDFYSTHRAQRSIRRADLVLMLFDASQRISKVDKQLCKYVTDQFKPCVLVVNKWDLMVNQIPTERWVNYLRDTFQTMWHVPIAFITGQTGKNMKVKSWSNVVQTITFAHFDRPVKSACGSSLRASSASIVQTPTSENLLRDASCDSTAYTRADLQRAKGVCARLSPLLAGRISRSTQLWRSPNQNVLEQADAGRQARRDRPQRSVAPVGNGGHRFGLTLTGADLHGNSLANAGQIEKGFQ